MTTERPQVDVSGLFDEMLRVMEEDEAYQESDILECIKSISPEQRSLLVTHIVNSSKVRSEPFSELPLHIYAHVELCMRQCLGKRMTAISDQSTSNLEDIKQAQKNNYHALYFVSGYILRSVQNAKNWDSQSADFIVEWATPGFVDNIVTEWTDRVDRGGLTRPSQDFFNLIKTMDYIATHCLQSVNNNLNLTQYIMNSILSHSDFTIHLDTIPNDLLYKISRCFTQIRCKAYVKKFMNSNNSASLRQSLVGTTKSK